MNKRANILLSVIFASSILTGCGTTNPSIEESEEASTSVEIRNGQINGVKDYSFDVSSNQLEFNNINFLEGIIAKDNDGNDITSSVTYEIKNSSGVKVTAVPSNNDAKYTITYTVKDSSLNTYKATSIIRVGNPPDSVVANAPKIKGNKDYSFDVGTEGYIIVKNYDFKTGITISDVEDGDITSSLTYVVTNYYNGDRVSIIDLTIDGKYFLDYYVTDADHNTTMKRNFVVVGDPVANLDAEGNPKTFPNTTSEMDKISSSYQLVFEEDYNYTGLPGTVQGEADYNGYYYQTGGGGWGNNEVQVYEKENPRTCYVSDGKLKIQVVKQGDTYYSVRLNTNNTLSANWVYGKYEVIAKLPTGTGPWPAIWMMPNDSKYGGWPASGEIDIMETSAYYTNKVLGTIHCGKFNGSAGTHKGGSTYTGSTIYNGYHKYSIEWLPDRIRFLYDDTCYFTYRPSDWLTKEADKVTSDIWPFDKAFHFIFNIAMGGNMGGTISSALFNDYSEIAMYIDKVSVYQSTYVNEKYR